MSLGPFVLSGLSWLSGRSGSSELSGPSWSFESLGWFGSSVSFLSRSSGGPGRWTYSGRCACTVFGPGPHIVIFFMWKMKAHGLA